MLLAIPASADAAALDDPAEQWLPRSDGAEWVYEWSNSAYSPAPRREHYGIQGRARHAFRLRWQELGSADGQTPSAGADGLPAHRRRLGEPQLPEHPAAARSSRSCARRAGQCGNSVAGALYMLIWGTRSPVLTEPLLTGTRWSSLGGAGNDVASDNRYAGREHVRVPAFPNGLSAAKVESEVTQAGAIGDPSAAECAPSAGSAASVPCGSCSGTPAASSAPPSCVHDDARAAAAAAGGNLLPLNRGDRADFRWRNSRHMREWSRQQFEVARWSTTRPVSTSSTSRARSPWPAATSSPRA